MIINDGTTTARKSDRIDFIINETVPLLETSIC